MVDRARRQRMIAEALAREPVPNQETLRRRLAKQGLVVTQATLSRDLRDLGAMRGPEGYRLAGTSPSAPAILVETLKLFVRDVRSGGTLVVLRTGAGQAQIVASQLDLAPLPGQLGTVAGDDAIFLAANDARSARSISRTIHSLMRSTINGSRT